MSVIYMDLIQLFFGVASNLQINPGRLNATSGSLVFWGHWVRKGGIYM